MVFNEIQQRTLIKLNWIKHNFYLLDVVEKNLFYILNMPKTATKIDKFDMNNSNEKYVIIIAV